MSARYHHGNLRRALLDAALALFAERNDVDFTFRELARAAGVTHNAPYRHFAGRTELLDALTEEGFAALTASVEAALAKAEGVEARVTALGEGYIQFALAQPVLFRLVLAHPVDGAHARRRGGAYALLEKTLEEAQREGAVRDDLGPQELALAAWSLVHGAASLLSSGRLPKSPAKLKALTRVLATSFFHGVRRRAQRP